MALNVRGSIIAALLILLAMGGNSAGAQAVVFNDINSSVLTVNGVPLQRQPDGSYVFSQTYKDSDFAAKPKADAGELIFLDPAYKDGGVSDVFRYVIDPLKGDYTHIHIRFASEDDGPIFGHPRKSNILDEPNGYVPIGAIDPSTHVNYEFFDASGKAMLLPEGLTISAASQVPEPSTAASIALFSALLALLGAIRLRRRTS